MGLLRLCGVTRRRGLLRLARCIPNGKRRAKRRCSLKKTADAARKVSRTRARGDCAICLAPLADSSLQTLSCSHVFHTDCIQELRRHKSAGACPLCRQHLVELRSVQELKRRAELAMARSARAGSARRASLFAAEAEELSREIALLKPSDGFAHFNLALMWYELGDLDRAIAGFRAALSYSSEMSSRSADIHCNLGMAFFDKGDLDSALSAYRAALICDPHSLYAHANLGNALYQQGNLNGAITQYRHALRCDPNDCDVSCNLGDALYEKGRLRSAIRVYRAAASRSPDNVVVACKLANALFEVWDLSGAVREYEAVLSRDPRHWEACYNLWFTKREMRKLSNHHSREAIGEK